MDSNVHLEFIDIIVVTGTILPSMSRLWSIINSYPPINKFETCMRDYLNFCSFKLKILTTAPSPTQIHTKIQD